MKINGVELPGVRMGKGFKDELLSPNPLKEFVTNQSRLEHGERTIALNPKFSKRSLTLEFQVTGRTKVEFTQNKDRLYAHLYSGVFVISDLPFTGEVFNLIYTGKSISYSSGLTDLACKIKASFDEPNPGERVHMETYDREINIRFGGDTHEVEDDTLVIEGNTEHQVENDTLVVD